MDPTVRQNLQNFAGFTVRQNLQNVYISTISTDLKDFFHVRSKPKNTRMACHGKLDTNEASLV